jgi:hypothetical protein
MIHPERWLPQGKRAAICLTIDDIHPGRSTDAYEAGGDLGRGALGHVEWLLRRHPRLRVTLFTTADWREISPLPTRRLLQRIPLLRDQFYLARVLPKGTMRLDRHPEFVRYLRGLPRTEIGLHGLYHVHKGPKIPLEFQNQSYGECRAMLEEMVAIFRRAGIDFTLGMTPPGWNVTRNLIDAMADTGLRFVASARDVRTAISPEAVNGMSGLPEVSIIYPQFVGDGRLLHLPTNFQATSEIDRAHDVIRHGGLLSIKAHIIKRIFDYVALDGLDELYRNYLDVLLSRLEDQYGDELWWTSMGEVSEAVHAGRAEEAARTSFTRTLSWKSRSTGPHRPVCTSKG